MENISTDITLDSDLLSQAESVADEMEISRDRLVNMALEEFIARYQSRHELEQIHQSHIDAPDEEEKQQFKFMRRAQRKLLEGDEW